MAAPSLVPIHSYYLHFSGNFHTIVHYKNLTGKQRLNTKQTMWVKALSCWLLFSPKSNNAPALWLDESFEGNHPNFRSLLLFWLFNFACLHPFSHPLRLYHYCLYFELESDVLVNCQVNARKSEKKALAHCKESENRSCDHWITTYGISMLSKRVGTLLQLSIIT